MQDLQEFYYDALLSETAKILADETLDKRRKFAKITTLSNTILPLYQIQSLDSINFQDLYLDAYADAFKSYPFRQHKTMQSSHQEV